MEAHGIEPFDLVVSNLYPFGSDPADFEHGAKGAEDLIDIGGPALIRAAAKNHARVGVLVDPADRTRAMLFEMYDDERAFDAHQQTAHFKKYMAEAVPLLASRERQVFRKAG